MVCNHCGNVVRLRAEFCPNCGQRVVVSVDDIITTSHDDAARRRGESLNGKLRVGILVLLILFSVLIGFIWLFDRKLTFDGSALPSFPAHVTYATASVQESLEKPYTDIRPLPPLPAPSLRVMGHRSGTLRTALRAANGGAGGDYDSAISRGLTFLAATQDKDGGWPVAWVHANTPLDATTDFKWGKVGVSSLALLAYLGDGHTWLRDDAGGRSAHGETVRRAVRFLMASQDGASGRFGGSESHFMYNHAMATLAMAEAAALTGDVELRDHAAKGLEYLTKTQTARGGWDYYGHTDSQIDDISVSAWAVQALAAGHEAGMAVPPETLEKALAFYRLLSKGERGVYNFQQDDGQYVPARSGMVLMCRQLLGDGPAMQDIKLLASKLAASIPKIKSDWSRWDAKAKDLDQREKFDPYMLYFCSYGMFFTGGAEWQEWNPKASKAIFEMQDRTDGAWRANDTYSKQGGTCYSTALCVLALQAHHRILHSVSSKQILNTKDE